MAKILGFEGKPDGLAGRLLQRMPGGQYVQEQIERIEHRVLSELKTRLDDLEKPATSLSVLAVQVINNPRRKPHTPTSLMRELLSASTEQTREESLTTACIAILRTLVPDEARILSTLSDGTGYPLIHVMAGPKLSLSAHPALEHVSSIGRAAGVLAPELTSLYLRHLYSWGLTETTQEDSAQRTGYELLESDDAVRKAIARLEKNGERVRIVRRTLRMSDLGMKVWASCEASELASS
jgi:hypothetical protein